MKDLAYALTPLPREGSGGRRLQAGLGVQAIIGALRTLHI
jgi:hypothetical protein